MSEDLVRNFTKNRGKIRVLAVFSNRNIQSQVMLALKSIGISQITNANSHVKGLEQLKVRTFPLVIYDAKDSDMPAIQFIEQAIDLDDQAILIPISGEPQVDDVFSMLKAGARGFLVVPFNAETMEQILHRAHEGAPFSEAVLNAPDRDSALVGVVLNNLYRLSVIMRQAREFASAAREVERYKQHFVESIDLAKMFSEGGNEALIERTIEGCINRANTAATRLGRTRKRLKKERVHPGPGEENSQAGS